jgi:hypothetical protein
MGEAGKSMFKITALVNAKIAAGVLPAIHIGQIWVGDGTEIRCECCEQNTSLCVQKVEIDLPGTVTLRMHRRCHQHLAGRDRQAGRDGLIAV